MTALPAALVRLFAERQSHDAAAIKFPISYGAGTFQIQRRFCACANLDPPHACTCRYLAVRSGTGAVTAWPVLKERQHAFTSIPGVVTGGERYALAVV